MSEIKITCIPLAGDANETHDYSIEIVEDGTVRSFVISKSKLDWLINMMITCEKIEYQSRRDVLPNWV